MDSNKTCNTHQETSKKLEEALNKQMIKIDECVAKIVAKKKKAKSSKKTV